MNNYFIGVTLPFELEKYVERKRLWVREFYSCSSGHSTRPHVTIVPPFSFPLSPCDIEVRLNKALKNFKGFDVGLLGFDSFSDRTIFIALEKKKEWEELLKILLKSLEQRREKGSFTPHITIANRDIPKGKKDEILEFLKLDNITQSLLVDSITLFLLTNRGWKEEKRIFIQAP